MLNTARFGGFLGLVGVLLYLLVGVLYFGSALVMPYPWVFGMWGLWIGGFTVLFRIFRDSRPWTPAVPVGAVILWVVIVQLGSWLFGWTA
jgi:hypothetical protein